MKPINITRTIHAPIDLVFDTVSDIRNFSKAVPDIINVTFLSEQSTGVGTRFIETRKINGKEASTELEVTAFKENDYVRIVTDSHGTVWNSLFTVQEQKEFTELSLLMEAEAHSLISKVMNPIMKYFIRKALIKDMDAVKAYCEKEYQSDKPQ